MASTRSLSSHHQPAVGTAGAATAGARRLALLVLGLSGAAIVVVEAALMMPGHVLAGQIADAALVFILLSFGSTRGAHGAGQEARAHWLAQAAENPREEWDRIEGPGLMTRARRTEARWPARVHPGHAVAAMRALALIPLSRVVALGLPLRHGSNAAALLVVASLIGFAALRLAPVAGLRPRALLAVPRYAIQLEALVVGAALGLVVYLLGAPPPLPADAPVERVLLAVTALAVAAAVEEFIFRGLVQVTSQRVAGRAGLVAASVLFASIYLDAGSVALVLVFALAGMLFAHVVGRTGALGGTIGGHTLLAVGAAFIWPAALGRPHPDWLPGEAVTIGGLALALTLATWIAIRRPVVDVVDDRQ